ncbi:hypothetical protein HLB44_18165 [Aquincola sp. S2]|uniref:RES domain-containing protein n=1 Tax=Pseudaquabacterium terrae TaxID=2732868 RepID=A0ABX2EJT4_9BURK|nr:hypothetical protein [Aquabacterium terrae]NRF68922.1 hypothetical protein [Aquabacterium terrae]
MPLLGKAAMLLSFDVVPEAIPEHDDWHTHEHLPERLSIPGFRRGTRWVALQGQPRYLVLYEVADLDTLASDAYLERLNHPTPWTANMMPHYRGMRRGLCSILGSHGVGMGHVALLSRFKLLPGQESALVDWLNQEILPPVPMRRGLGSVHLFRGALAAQMTREQRIRGVDDGVDCALLITGYSQDALVALAQVDLGSDRLEEHGAAEVATALYRTDYSLTCNEVAA